MNSFWLILLEIVTVIIFFIVIGWIIVMVDLITQHKDEREGNRALDKFAGEETEQKKREKARKILQPITKTSQLEVESQKSPKETEEIKGKEKTGGEIFQEKIKEEQERKEEEERRKKQLFLRGDLRGETFVSANISLDIFCYLSAIRKELETKGLINNKTFWKEYLTHRKKMIKKWNRELAISSEILKRKINEEQREVLKRLNRK